GGVWGLEGEVVDLLELAGDEWMILWIAQGAQGENGVGHGGEDAAEPARHGQPLLEPTPRRFQRASAERARSEALPPLEGVIHPDEEVLPDEELGGERARDALEADARLFARHRPQLLEPARLGETLHQLSIRVAADRPVHPD